METKIENQFTEYKAYLKKNEDGKWVLLLKAEKELPIDLSAEDQEYLKDIFNELIGEMLNHPFHFVFIAAEEKEALGLNEVCEKYIAILNNDLKGVREDYENNLKRFKADNSVKN